MSTSSSSASDDSSDPDNLSDWTDIVQNVAQYTPHLNVKITEWEDTGITYFNEWNGMG